MYIPDGSEVIMQLTEFPLPLPGAPRPVLIADDRLTWLAYYCMPAESEDFEEPELVTTNSAKDKVVVIECKPYACYFGSPNIDALDKHPLGGSGKIGEGIFEIRKSPWIKELSPPSGFSKFRRDVKTLTWRHLLFVFHDNVVEMVVRDISWSICDPPLRDAIFKSFYRSTV